MGKQTAQAKEVYWMNATAKGLPYKWYFKLHSKLLKALG